MRSTTTHCVTTIAACWSAITCTPIGTHYTHRKILNAEVLRFSEICKLVNQFFLGFLSLRALFVVQHVCGFVPLRSDSVWIEFPNFVTNFRDVGRDMPTCLVSTCIWLSMAFTLSYFELTNNLMKQNDKRLVTFDKPLVSLKFVCSYFHLLKQS